MVLTGIITSDGFVETSDKQRFILPIKGTDEDGFPEVLIDSKNVNKNPIFKRQSIKSLIGKEVEFITNNGIDGFNFKIL